MSTVIEIALANHCKKLSWTRHRKFTILFRLWMDNQLDRTCIKVVFYDYTGEFYPKSMFEFNFISIIFVFIK